MAECPTGVLISFDDEEVSKTNLPVKTPKKCLTYSSEYEPFSPLKFDLVNSIKASPKFQNSLTLDSSNTSLLEDQDFNLIMSTENEDEVFFVPFNDQEYNKKKENLDRHLSAKQIAEVYTEATKLAARFRLISASQDKENQQPNTDFNVNSLKNNKKFSLDIPSIEENQIDDSLFTQPNSKTDSTNTDFSCLQSTAINKNDNEGDTVGSTTCFSPSLISPVPSIALQQENSSSNDESEKANFPRQLSATSVCSTTSGGSCETLEESDSVKLNESTSSTASNVPLIKKPALIKPGFRLNQSSSASSWSSIDEGSGAQKRNVVQLQKSLSLHSKSKNQPIGSNGPIKAFAEPKMLPPRKTQSFKEPPRLTNSELSTNRKKLEIQGKPKSVTPIPVKSQLRAVGTPVRLNRTQSPKVSSRNLENSSTPIREKNVVTSTPVSSRLTRRQSVITPRSSLSSINSPGSRTSLNSTDSSLKLNKTKSNSLRKSLKM